MILKEALRPFMKKFLSRVHSAYDAPSPADARETRSIFKPRMRRPNFLASVVVNTIRALALIVLILMLAGAGAVVGIARAYVDTAPSLDLTLIDDQAQTSFIYDAQGNLITDYKGTEDRVMVSISQMPMRLRNAFVAVEDARFYTHNGIDVKRIIGAFVKNFVSGSQQGGSTITQQLIKNTILSSEQSYKRKIQEAYLAMQLETQYSKEQILESYLNTIYLGENYYGVYTAARGYFGKELYQLSLRECAMLAGLCTNPYYYNPRRNYYTRTSETTDYAAITNTRTDYALRMMYENQFITYEEYVAALEPSTATVLRQSPDAGSTYNYIYYVEYAVNDVVQTLLKLNNLENTSYNRNLMENELPKFHGEYDDDMLYEKAGEILDEKDIIQDNYMLEVSSPGLDRVLKKDKDFRRYAGSDVDVKLFAPLEEAGGGKAFTAHLEGLTEEGDLALTLDGGKEIALHRDKISQVRLHFSF